MEFVSTIIRFFQEGGPFMYPIALVLAVGFALVIERWLVLTQAKVANRRDFNRIVELVQRKDYKGVMQLAQSSKAAISRIVAAAVGKTPTAKSRDDLEYAMEEGVLETLPRLEKRTAYIGTLANIATLLGLLGTIIGLIAAFTAVADADPTKKAELLSRSISVAMNTTAFGLMSAIPLLLFHSLLQSKTTEIVDGLEMAGVKCLNIMTSEPAAPKKSPAAK